MKIAINSDAESSHFFHLMGRLRQADPKEADEILDTLLTMRDRASSAVIRARCALLIVKHRGFRSRVSNGALAAAIALSISFITQAATLDGVINFLDLIA